MKHYLLYIISSCIILLGIMLGIRVLLTNARVLCNGGQFFEFIPVVHSSNYSVCRLYLPMVDPKFGPEIPNEKR